MAPWYELVFAADLKDDVPPQIIDVLNYLIAPPFNEKTLELEPILVPDHAFFRKYGWHTLLLMECAYFPGDIAESLNLDEYTKFYKFTLRAKHRDADLSASFLHWFVPYSRTQGFVGYTRCDEDENIDLIYFENNHVYYKSVEFYVTPPRIRQAEITEDGDVIFEDER